MSRLAMSLLSTLVFLILLRRSPENTQNNIPLHPIITSINTAPHNIAKHITKISTRLLSTINPSHSKNSGDKVSPITGTIILKKFKFTLLAPLSLNIQINETSKTVSQTTKRHLLFKKIHRMT